MLRKSFDEYPFYEVYEAVELISPEDCKYWLVPRKYFVRNQANINPQMKLDVEVSSKCPKRTISGMIGLGSKSWLEPRNDSSSPRINPLLSHPLSVAYNTTEAISTHSNPLNI